MRSTRLLIAALVFAPGLNLAQAKPVAAAVPLPHRLDARTPQGLRELFQPAAKPLPFVSAHRGGGRKGFPENCIATFEDTLRHTPALMEIDPRFTKDGAIVVHHDPTLERTTTGKGKVEDFTLAELKRLRLKDSEGRVTDFRIPTLDEVLDWARGRTIVVLDQKDVPLATRVGKITEHRAEAFAMVIVNSFKDARACHALNPDVMMEVMIPNRKKAEEFGTLGIPWNHVIAFVGHAPPEDAALYEFIRRQGASCMIGTSRNLDLRVITGKVPDIKALEPDYRALLRRGANLIETDIPTLLGPLLQSPSPVPGGKQKPLVAPPTTPVRFD